MAGWATFTTRVYSWIVGQFCASQADAKMLDGLIVQRYLYFVVFWCSVSCSCLVVIHNIFCDMAGRATFTTRTCSWLAGQFCASQVMPTFWTASFFNDIFYFCRFLVVPFLSQSYFVHMPVDRVFQDTSGIQEFSTCSIRFFNFLFISSVAFSAHMVAFSLFLYTRIFGSMVWLVFLWISAS